MDPAKLTTLSSTLGIMATTIFLSMNHTINYLTIPSLLLGSPLSPGATASKAFKVPATEAPETTPNHLNRQWQEIYNRGHLIGIPTAIGGFAAYLTAAYFSKAAGGEALNSRLFLAAGVVALSVTPYTLVFMVPTNNALHARGDALSAGREGKGSEEETMAMLRKWVRMSKVRANLAVLAVGLAVAGVVL